MDIILFLLSILDHLIAIIECVALIVFVGHSHEFPCWRRGGKFLGFLSVDFNLQSRSRMFRKNAPANSVSGLVLKKGRFH